MSEGAPQPTGGRVLLDSLAVATLFTIGLLPLNASYQGVEWLVVGLVGMALGVATAILVRARGYGPGLAIPLLALVYLALAGSVALRDAGFFAGVPDPSALGDVLEGTVSSWVQLLETAPPADSSGTLLLIPFLLGVIGAGTAASLALGSTRHPGIPVFPLLAVLVATALMGSQEWWTVLIAGHLFAALSIAWVVLRGPRSEQTPARGLAAQLPRAAAVVMVVAVPAALIPWADRIEEHLPERVVLRERVLGYDARGLNTPLTDFRRFTRQPKGARYNLHDTVLLRAEGLDPGTRLRFVALDAYDGDRWYASSRQDPSTTEDRFLRIGSRLEVPEGGGEVSADVDVKAAWDLPWVPTTGALETLEFYSVVGDERRSQLRYNPTTGTMVLVPVLAEDEDYAFTATLERRRLGPRMRPWPHLPPALVEQAAFVAPLAQRMAGNARAPMRKVFQAAARLRERGRYANGDLPWLRVPPGHDEDRLGEGFLEASRAVGDEEQYAAAMALIAVDLGVPARVVVGAKVPPHGRVRGADVTAWVELRVQDGSWRVLDTDAFMSRRPPRRDEPARPMSQPPQKQQPQQPQAPQRPRPEDQGTREDDRTETSSEGLDPRWLLLLLLAPGTIPLAKVVRRRRRRGATRPSRRLAGAWAEVVDRGRDLGLTVPVRTTRPAQARASDVDLTLARRVDLGIFGPEPPGDDAVQEAWSASDDLRRQLSGRVRRWRRIFAPWSPVSLLRRD